MDSYKKYTMDKADLILQPIIGGESGREHTLINIHPKKTCAR